MREKKPKAKKMMSNVEVGLSNIQHTRRHSQTTRQKYYYEISTTARITREKQKKEEEEEEESQLFSIRGRRGCEGCCDMDFRQL